MVQALSTLSHSHVHLDAKFMCNGQLVWQQHQAGRKTVWIPVVSQVNYIQPICLEHPSCMRTLLAVAEGVAGSPTWGPPKNEVSSLAAQSWKAHGGWEGLGSEKPFLPGCRQPWHLSTWEGTEAGLVAPAGS